MILLVEDNEQILSGNERMLRRRGYDVKTALTLNEARQCMRTAMPDVIVLDIMLPDGSGLDFMREVRSVSNIPILILTGLTTSGDIVRGLAEGGDDYLSKPYDFDVLLARVEALLRRAALLPDVLQKGDLILDVLSDRAFLHGRDLLLTQKDFAILLLLTQNEGRVISANYLYQKVWNAPMSGDTRAVKTAVSRLRKKLDGSGYAVSSIRNEGYLFERK